MIDIMNYLYAYYVKDKSQLAVILTTYKRLENLPGTYKSLAKQTNTDFDLYICDNSGNDPHLLNTTKKNVKNFTHNVFIKEYNNEYSIFGRFFLAKDLAEKGYTKVVFIDDDQVIPESFVQDCYDQYDEKAIKSFYAHFIEGDYWSKQEINHYEEGNYAGGGGLLCNAKLFLDENFFKCPEEYYILDDLWLSYYIIKCTDYKIKKLRTPIKFIVDQKATARGLKAEKRQFSRKYITGDGKISI
jgi:glycosyltransferase involved in cell wall biosynthesis